MQRYFYLSGIIPFENYSDVYKLFLFSLFVIKKEGQLKPLIITPKKRALYSSIILMLMDLKHLKYFL